MKKLFGYIVLLLAVVLLLQGCGLLVLSSSLIIGNSILNSDNPKLREALANMTSYEVDYNYTAEGEPEENYIYYADDNIIKQVWQKDNYLHEDYLELFATGHNYYFYTYDGRHLKISPDSKYFKYFGTMFYGLSELDPSAFTETAEGEWSVKRKELQEEACLLVGANDAESFTDFTLTVKNGAVTGIELESYYKSSSETVNCSYTLSFSNYGNVELSLPEYSVVSDTELLQYAPISILYYSGSYNGLPTEGSPNLLVVPVAFPGVKNTYPSALSELRTAFSGSASQTGWQSVKSYYSASSFGKLKLNFTVTDTYTCSKSASYFGNLYKNNENMSGADSPEQQILSEVLDFLDDKYDLSDFDSDGDNIIDGIYLIYLYDTDYSENDTLWWSWENTASDYRRIDGVFAGEYVWTGIDTLHEYITEDFSPKINATTLIHETGHMLGLNDYYDYYPKIGPSGGLGGGDMMDYSVGDHCPASKLMLGWANPVEVTESGSYTLSPYVNDGQCLVINKESADGFYCEYFAIDLYTTGGLYRAAAGSYGLPDTYGIRIWQVDATVADDFGGRMFYSYNSDNSETDHKFVRLIEADGKNDIENGGFSNNSDLFGRGDRFGAGESWYDGSQLGFTVEVSWCSSTSATVTITFSE